jgi:hypothetical protein
MEEELSRQFGKLSAAGESDSREEQSEDFESQHDLNDSYSNGKCNLIVNYLPHDIDDISLKVKFIIWCGRGCTFKTFLPVFYTADFICRPRRDCHD